MSEKEIYRDPERSPGERAEDLLSKLSLEEKVRQIGGASVLMMAPMETQDLENGCGGIVIGMSFSERFLDDVVKVQDYVMDHSPHRIPALFHTEALAGPWCMLGGNLYPVSIGLGATFDPEIVREMAEITSRQMAANGVRHALSPVADLARDLRWGRCNETYGGDPTLSAAMTVAFVRGMQGDDLKKGTAATAKHFLGYSVSENALNCHMTLVPYTQLREQFAKPFEAAIHLAGLKCVMNSYAAVNGMPVTANKAILNDLLREDLGFDGLTVSDYGSLNQLKEPYRLAGTDAEAAVLALEAGMDVEFPDHTVYADDLVRAVREGRADESLIDRSVLRVLRLKFELGLFENPYGVGDYAAAMDPEKANRGSLEAARKSIVLTKNNGILPLNDRKKKIAVLGPCADSLRLLCSHYTSVSMHEMIAQLSAGKPAEKEDPDLVNIMNQGRKEDVTATLARTATVTDRKFFDGEIRRAYPGAKTIAEAIEECFDDVSFAAGCDYKGKDIGGFSKALELAAEADAVVFCGGEKSGIDASCTSGEGGDATSLSLPGMQEQLLREVAAVNGNVVLVHTGSRPLALPWAYENLAAVVEAWFPSPFGGTAVADVLTGKVNPGGKLPVDAPRSAAHLPVYHMQYNGSSADDAEGLDGTGYIDGPSTSLLPFGYGLSYTSFECSDLSVSWDAEGNLGCSVRVANTGDRDGEEVVQLYGRDEYASMVRPRQELIGFKRVFLRSGESATVRFLFNIDILSFVGYNKEWKAEAGDFSFFIGFHSKDRRLTFSYTLPETHAVDPGKRCFFAAAEIL